MNLNLYKNAPAILDCLMKFADRFEGSDDELLHEAKSLIKKAKAKPEWHEEFKKVDGVVMSWNGNGWVPQNESVKSKLPV